MVTIKKQVMKISFIAVILSLTVSGSAFANNSDLPSFRGIEHFQRKFPQATEVVCKVKGEFTEVRFMWNGLRLLNFYDAAGDPIATSRTLTLNNLPHFTQMSLNNKIPS